MPSIRAIHASAMTMAAARLRISAPRPTPIAANAMLAATPPPSVPGVGGREMKGAALGRPPGGRGAQGGQGADQAGGRAEQRVDGQLGGGQPASIGKAEVAVGDSAVPVLARHGQDAEDEGEDRGETHVRERRGLHRRVVHVPAGHDQAADAGHDEQWARGQQQPRTADGDELAEFAADHGRSARHRGEFQER